MAETSSAPGLATGAHVPCIISLDGAVLSVPCHKPTSLVAVRAEPTDAQFDRRPRSEEGTEEEPPNRPASPRGAARTRLGVPVRKNAAKKIQESQKEMGCPVPFARGRETTSLNLVLYRAGRPAGLVGHGWERGARCGGRCGLRLEKEVFSLESAGTTARSSP